MDLARLFLVVGLALTLVGALVLAWHDLRGGFRGDRKVTQGELELGMPRTGASRAGFPLIAVGTALQIAGVVLT